jgi:benzoylsuccinyl-CoA thiolase BbsB subunit
MIQFGKFPERSIEQLGLDAVYGLIKKMNLDRDKIDAVFSGSVFGGPLTSQRVLKELGMTGISIFNLENACASGASAFHLAWQSIATGVNDVVMVMGVEKLSKFGGGTLPIDPEDIEGNHGIVMPGVYAMRAQRYMHDYGATAEDLAQVAVKNHYNGSLNPYAQYRNILTVEEVMASRMIAEPFTLYHCCPNSADGAAAVLICASDRAKEFSNDSMQVRASVITSGYFKGGYRDLTFPEITYRAAKKAYQMAGLEPKDIDLAEVHDAFTIAEILYYEAMGFCEKGQGYRFVREGKASLDGQVAVNPSGGLMSRGHPLGSTGVAQIVEVFWHLTGQAGERQVKNARIGLTHVTGGGISGLDNGACGVHIFSAQ